MANKNIYTEGGPVQANNEGVYITRKVDTELLEYCRKGEYVYVLCPRQVGKSSLMYRTANELKKDKILTVIIDLEIQKKERPKEEEWYFSILRKIKKDLLLEIDLLKWWKENKDLGEPEKFTDFINDIVLTAIRGKVVIFIDEIDTTLGVRFTDGFFTAVRSMYNGRAVNNELRRVSFVFVGTASPTDFIKDPRRTPFNIGQRVDLTDFTPQEALPLAYGLAKSKRDASRVLEMVFEWTGGHPYLTQKVLKKLSESKEVIDFRSETEEIVKNEFLNFQDSNIQFVRSMLLVRAKSPRDVMRLYDQVLSGNDITDSEQSINKSHLKLSGIVRVVEGYYRVSNKIYKEAFNKDWVIKSTPLPKILVLFATQAAFILLLLFGYFFFFQQPLYVLFAVWLIVGLISRINLNAMFSRVRGVMSKPGIFYKDPEPTSIPFYPRGFLEDVALDFRDALTNPLNNIIKSVIARLGTLAKIVSDSVLPSRLVGYVFFMASFLMFIFVNVTFLSDALSVSNSFPSNNVQRLPQSFGGITLIGSILALVNNILVISETRSEFSLFSSWSDRDQSTKSLAFMISAISVPFSILGLASWVLSNLAQSGNLTWSSTLALNLIDWAYYVLIPINAATATFIVFSDAIRGTTIILVLFGWLIVGFIYLLNKFVTALGIVGPWLFDWIYRLFYGTLDMVLWFIVTPVQASLLPFRFIQDRLLASPEDKTS